MSERKPQPRLDHNSSRLLFLALREALNKSSLSALLVKSG
jgi:hypothetical protein